MQKRWSVTSLRGAEQKGQGQSGKGQHGRSFRPLVRALVCIGAAVVVFVVDWMTKASALRLLRGHPRHIFGPLWLRLEFNTGVAFSIGAGHPALAAGVASVLVIAVAFAASKMDSIWGVLGAGMVIGGAVGNLTDRLLLALHGAAVDFIWTGFWPTFNLADVSIVVGCVLMVMGLPRR